MGFGYWLCVDSVAIVIMLYFESITHNLAYNCVFLLMYLFPIHSLYIFNMSRAVLICVLSTVNYTMFKLFK